MSDRTDEGRRRFLASAGGAALGVAVSPLLGLAGCAPSSTLTGALADFYADRRSAGVVGAAFLARFPDEDDVTRLVRQLAGSTAAVERWEATARSDPADLHRVLRERHRTDFEAGRVALLNGWILSQTEVRLCALVAKLG